MPFYSIDCGSLLGWLISFAGWVVQLHPFYCSHFHKTAIMQALLWSDLCIRPCNDWLPCKMGWIHAFFIVCAYILPWSQLETLVPCWTYAHAAIDWYYHQHYANEKGHWLLGIKTLKGQELPWGLQSFSSDKCHLIGCHRYSIWPEEATYASYSHFRPIF